MVSVQKHEDDCDTASLICFEVSPRCYAVTQSLLYRHIKSVMLFYTHTNQTTTLVYIHRPYLNTVSFIN
jgi:hypothetical protein